MPWPVNLVLKKKETCLFGTDTNKCHIIMSLIVFPSENETCDAQTITVINCESYHNHNIFQNINNIFFFYIVQP